MKMQGFKYALWGINVIIVIGIGLSMTLLVLARDNPPSNPVKDLDEKIARKGQTSSPVEDRLSEKDVESLWKAHIRQKPPPPPETRPVDVSAPGPGQAPPLSNFITVAGLFGDQVVVTYLSQSDPAHKTAELDKEKQPKQKYVTMNTAVADVKPEAIPIRFEGLYPGAVIFAYDGREISLPIVREDPGAPPTAALPGHRGPGGFRPGGEVKATGRVPAAEGEVKDPEDESEITEAKEIRPGQWQIPASEKEYITNNANDILNQIGVEDYNEGDVKGVKLSSLGDSLVAQRGFKEGDIIKNVNGQPITSQAELINYAKKVGDRLQVVRVDFIRQGKPMSTTFHLK